MASILDNLLDLPFICEPMTPADLELPGMPEPTEPPPGSIAATMNEWKRYRTLVAENDGLIAPAVAAVVLGVHRSRVQQFMAEGRLATHTLFGKPYLGVSDVESFAVRLRPTGRYISRPSGDLVAA